MTFAQLEAFIFEKVSDSYLPGLSAVAVKGNDVIWAKGFGFRNLDYGLAATPHTLYGIGSLTKSFTAMAIMQLAEQGKLSLTDPIDTYVPLDVHPHGQPILLWHLLTHSSGIPALGYAESVLRGVTGAGEDWLPIASAGDLLHFMREAQSWVVSAPGERWFYLNEGYAILGEVIARCSDMSYGDYVQAHILAPLNMQRSFFHKAQVDQDQDAATPYIITRDRTRIPSTYPYGAITADGGLISNALDLANYLAMYLAEGRFGGVQLLSPQSVQAMCTSRITLPLQHSSFGDPGYAYGFVVFPAFLGHQLVDHSGSVHTATAYFGFLPQQQVGIALLANGSGHALSQLGFYGLALLLGEDPEQLPFVQRERMLRSVEGVYETYKSTMQAEVKRSGDFLTVRMRTKYNDMIVPLIPETLEEHRRLFYTLIATHKLPVEFHLRDHDIELLFERYCLRRTGKLP